MIAVAKQHGVSEVVEDSSGNAGASVSAYAGRAGMKDPHLRAVVCPSGKAQADRRLRSAGTLHPRAARGNDSGRSRICHGARSGIRLPRSQPLLRGGNETVCLRDVYRQSDGKNSEAHRHAGRERIASTGRAQGVLGAETGRAHCGDTPPARRSGKERHANQSRHSKCLPDAPPVESTVAGGIAVGTPARHRRNRSGHQGHSREPQSAVEENDILAWRNTLARTEGVYGEPTSAAAFAGLAQLVEQGIIQPAEQRPRANHWVRAEGHGVVGLV